MGVFGRQNAKVVIPADFRSRGDGEVLCFGRAKCESGSNVHLWKLDQGRSLAFSSGNFEKYRSWPSSQVGAKVDFAVLVGENRKVLAKAIFGSCPSCGVSCFRAAERKSRAEGDLPRSRQIQSFRFPRCETRKLLRTPTSEVRRRSEFRVFGPQNGGLRLNAIFGNPAFAG